ncbi:Uncharacterised protein [Halioglobus japonicus]|nr:Uncharacterised protein [Halioglobus japonicus]
MKRLIFAAVVIVVVGALTIWGDRILARTLDSELAPLLSKQLGLPVQLAPIKTGILRLKASSDKLIMGDPKDPAVVATSVVVTLAWADLLRGEIKLVYASADDLMVRPSRWPSSDSPLPQNYEFLDPYLPRTLEFETGRYVSDSGEDYPVNQFEWQRHLTGSASAAWVEKRDAGDVALQLQLDSLHDLLQLAPLTAELNIDVDGKADSAIALKAKIQPGKTSGYTMDITLNAAGMTAQTTATGETSWALPGSSETTIPLLDTAKLTPLLDSYRDSDDKTDLAALLASAPPRLDLPAHQGHVLINELHLYELIDKDSSFTFVTDEKGVQITDLTSYGPAGILSGQLGIVSDAQGWAVNVDAGLKAREAGGGIAPQYTGAEWLLSSGHATLKGQGDTWDTLLNSLQGDAALAGHHHSTTDMPIAITAALDKRPGEFTLQKLDIALGKGQLSGSVVLSGEEQRKLSIDLKGSHIDLGFLFDKPDSAPLPGLALPDYLNILPELELAVNLNIEDLQSPALKMREATATLERTSSGGKLVAVGKGTDDGVLNLTLEAAASPNEPTNFELKAQFSDLDIPDMFRQQGLFYSRSSGTLNFTSQGDGMKEVFTAMRGAAKVSVDVRPDNNWKRPASAAETLEFTGSSRLVIDKERIVGIEIEKLDITSIQQDLTGNLSLVAGRNPWFVAALESDKLDIDSLIALLPESTEESEDTELQPTLEKLGDAQATLNVKAMSLFELPLTDVELEVVSGTDLIDLKKMNFSTENGSLQSQGKMSWKDSNATLEGTAEVANIDLDQFLIHNEQEDHVPVSGSAKLNSEGRNIGELLSNLTGYINLQADKSAQSNTLQARRQLTMKATRLSNGMEADISSLQWGETELTGTVRYYKNTPPMLAITIHSGTLSLLPWENAYLKEDKKNKAKKKDSTSSTLASVAKTSADYVGDVLLAPLRFLSDDESTTKPGDKLFSSDPLPLDALEGFNATVSAQLDSLLSTAVSAKNISLTGDLTAGQLSLKASSSELNQGNGEVDLAFNAKATPPTLKLTSTFENVNGLSSKNTYPRSGFVSLEGQGDSEAALAATTNGLIFLKLGKGPFDYANSVLLTANLASTVFQTLIPGIEKKKQEVECGVTVALFKDGKGVTPYGFAARTNQANLLGQLHIDLAKETMQMSFDSRGREGVGISVGSVFSNTVQIKGPLTDPGIVPNATGLLWRGWAAVMTGGLSVLGESLLKRVLASENPCQSIEKLISKELCPTNPIAASSPLVCPTS